jgi:hypothetical protein
MTDRTDRARDIFKAWQEEIKRAVERELGPEPEEGLLQDFFPWDTRTDEIGAVMRPQLLDALAREGLTEDDIPEDA